MSISALLGSLCLGLVDCFLVVARLRARYRKGKYLWEGEVFLLLWSSDRGDFEVAYDVGREKRLGPHEQLCGFRLLNVGLRDDLQPVIEEFFGEEFEPRRHTRFEPDRVFHEDKPCLVLRLRYPAGQAHTSPEHRLCLWLTIADNAPPVVVEVFWDPVTVMGTV